MHFTVNVAKKHFNAAVSDTGAAAQPERKIYQQRAAQSIDCIWFTGCVFQSLERSQPFLLAHRQTAIASHSVRLPPPASSSSSLCACELLVWWRCRNLRPETRDQDDVLLNSQCDTDLCTPKLIQFDGLELAEEGGGWCMGRGTLLSQAAGDAHSAALFIQSGSRSGLWGPWLANSAACPTGCENVLWGKWKHDSSRRMFSYQDLEILFFRPLATRVVTANSKQLLIDSPQAWTKPRLTYW